MPAKNRNCDSQLPRDSANLSRKPFASLRRQFQAAHGKFGRTAYHFFVVTPGEVSANQPLEKLAERLGFVQTGMGFDSGYEFWGQTAATGDAHQEFRRLATLAGESLPEKVRGWIPFPPRDSCSWWLAYMWWDKPPEIITAGGLSSVWFKPFRKAEDTILRGLNSRWVDKLMGGECVSVPTQPVARTVPKAALQKSSKRERGPSPETEGAKRVQMDASLEGRWSDPMTRTEMARRYTGCDTARARDAASLEKYGMHHEGGRKYRVRMDTMPAYLQEKFAQPVE